MRHLHQEARAAAAYAAACERLLEATRRGEENHERREARLEHANARAAMREALTAAEMLVPIP